MSVSCLHMSWRKRIHCIEGFWWYSPSDRYFESLMISYFCSSNMAWAFLLNVLWMCFRIFQNNKRYLPLIPPQLMIFKNVATWILLTTCEFRQCLKDLWSCLYFFSVDCGGESLIGEVPAAWGWGEARIGVCSILFDVVIRRRRRPGSPC